MRITDIRINGMNRPVGYDFEKIGVTFHLEDTEPHAAYSCSLLLSTDENFENIVYSSKADPVCETLLDYRPKGFTRCFVRITARNEKTGLTISSDSFFETGRMDHPFAAKWITPQCTTEYHPLFSKEFELSEMPVKARLYICGLGLYEASLNNRKISDEYLTPGLCDYEEEYEYQTYDILEYLSLKNNCIEVLLGNGWYKGRFGLGGKENNYGDSFLLIAEIRLWYRDGKEEIIASDETWTCASSAVAESSIYDGETVNDLHERTAYPVRTAEAGKPLRARKGLPVKAYQTWPVKKVIHTPADELVFDFGQNIAGFVTFENHLNAGCEIILDHGEALQNGSFSNENLRSAKAQFRYVSGGKQKEVRPHFTYYGFRYVRVRCDEKVDPADFRAVQICSAVERTGWFHCSDAKVNRLYENAFYSQLDNFVDIPTDCPQRDERLGWTGDAQMFAPTACFNTDNRAFYERFLANLHMYQKKHDGAVPNYFPMQDFLGGSAQVWGDAAVILPDVLKKYYGNRHFYEQAYVMMRQWIGYCLNHMADDQYMIKGHMQFGDWLALDGVTDQSMRGGTDEDYVASMYFCDSLSKTIAYGKELNKDVSDLEIIRDTLRQNILDEYFSNTGKLCVDTQTGFLLALRFGIYRDHAEIIRGLRRRLHKDAYRIRCGFAGAPNLLQILAENGMEREAMRFLLNEEYPGWLHEVNLGATTIWERWNSLLDDGSFSGTGMNSLNHYAYGNVCEFLYAFIGGIRPLKDGFKEVSIRPLITGYFKNAETIFRSAAGTYAVKWQIQDDGSVHVRVQIPYGCKAVLTLPFRETMTLEAGIFDETYMPDKDLRLVYDGDSFLCELIGCRTISEEFMRMSPQLYYMANGDAESRHLTLNGIMEMPYLGIDPQEVKKLIRFVSSIRYESD